MEKAALLCGYRSVVVNWYVSKYTLFLQLIENFF